MGINIRNLDGNLLAKLQEDERYPELQLGQQDWPLHHLDELDNEERVDLIDLMETVEDRLFGHSRRFGVARLARSNR